MKLIDSFKTKGLLSFGNSTWITIEPCVINNCKLDAGTILFDASICKVYEHVTSPGDLIAITDRSKLYFNCPYCGGSILSKDNEIESVDDLETCDFDVVPYDFTDSSVFYELNEGAGKTVPYSFGLNLDTALLFLGSWRVDINRFKLVFTTDDSESHLVSTKGNVVDNIILPVVNDIACNGDKVIE